MDKELSLLKKRSRSAGGWEAGNELENNSPEVEVYPGRHQKSGGQQGGGGIVPLCSVFVRSCLKYCIQVWDPQFSKGVELLE